MKWQRLLFFAAAFLATAADSTAQSGLYTANETSVDVFASYVAPERGISHLFETTIQHGSIGGGLGANYFLSPVLGLGADVNIPNNSGSFVDSTTANLILAMAGGQFRVSPLVCLPAVEEAYDPISQWIRASRISDWNTVPTTRSGCSWTPVMSGVKNHQRTSCCCARGCASCFEPRSGPSHKPPTMALGATDL